MKVLAIDTSNYTLGIAIIDEEKVIGEYITNVKKNHSIRVMPAIEMLLKDCNLTPNDLTKIVVAEGPGSYTGVRIGVTIAKTLAWTLKIPLVGVSSLEILAAAVGRYFPGAVSPLFDARRGQIYTGLYQYENGKIKTVEKDQILQSKDWAKQLTNLSQPVLFVGNDLPLHREIIVEEMGEQARFAELTELNPRPSELAFLGMNRDGEEVHNFVPNYIRLAEAETKWIEANQAKDSN
ncbi:tRNA (adenosine(37)-N6)-threonylcarbamoyltransferase complex dimerization subunit type 1 TsaB [Robertmurraya yapensis]|uniref:tRNA (Adenosine(37)-N6)-threonylcarbamoyltransferase complex dimerization subunit type 1 TsaB n=1 Tax=Bacillus yapensis TaxID=2492960 RepID=A0A431VWQ1_9BACI|nr:tRNA (adenosine(37)-N6)-threonylcarbamoyltransferase complex dimerization subunit type 1 TsaB [Bacillus yapensis]RTR27556.1 tRNA (adenosine(37)-N6)-threonylcarbamoyltransferase complex dimerization subunit type 1 TsaB [Bacillus yapensis]TKS94124.1 tRNA (adenosine(37)-N6)-threonylcarbamoyltransferase complex dimerization subunit type 1 TsaB [Bacillus yapensis]